MNLIEVKRLAVGQLETNCYFIYHQAGDQNVGIVVDPGDDATLILRKIKALDLKVEFIFVTHAHFDHIMAVGEVAKATGAPVVMHEDNEDYVFNPRLNLAVMMGCGVDFMGAPIKYIKAGDTLKAGDVTYTTVHTPGHIDGCCCLYSDLKARQSGLPIMITGDTLFLESIGRVDFPTGSMVKMNDSLKKLKEIYQEKGDFQIFPGHDDSSTLKHEVDFNHYFRNIN